MAAGVLGQVVAPHEPPVTHGAGELLLPGVGSPVPGELIGAGEPPLAALPAAAERLLPCVCSHVGLQMRAFEVGLATPWVATDVTSYPG